MNKINNIALLFILLILTLMLVSVGCRAPDGESVGKEAEDMIQPGETVSSEVHHLHFADRGGDASGEPFRPAMCDFAQDAGSIAIVEFGPKLNNFYRELDCSGPYQQGGAVFSLKVHAVAAGQELPHELNLVFLDYISGMTRPPREGESMLVTLRQARGEWFLAQWAHLEFRADEGFDAAQGLDLPTTFEELSTEALRLDAALERDCPTQAQRRMDDAEWERFNFDPTVAGCVPRDPDEQPMEDDEPVTDCSREDSPECCFDDSLPCP